MQIELSSSSVARLIRPVRGRGGFQQILRRVQPLITGNTLIVDEADFERLNRYSQSYGRGGFQERTRGPIDDSQLVLDFETVQ
jgi:hypothetical protein